jgi:putative transposase
MIYDFVLTNEKIFPIEKMCKVLEIGLRGYYTWKVRLLSKKKEKIIEIKKQINVIYFSSKQRYGSPRIKAELTFFGYKISRITVAKCMRDMIVK